MTWFLAVLLAAAAFALIVMVFKAPRSGWEALGAALLLGIAGYAMQASPGLPGAPKSAALQENGRDEAIVEARAALVEEKLGQPKDRYLVISDGFARNGQFANAAGVLIGAVEENPENMEAWLAMGNALLAHSQGNLTPASIYAYEQAAKAAPDQPGPPFFLGLGYAQSGQFEQARAVWAGLLKRGAPDAPWRAGLEAQVERLDAIIAARAAQGQAR